MSIKGQTCSDVVLKVVVPKGFAELNLGVCLVVENLGVQLLIGEPAKKNTISSPGLRKSKYPSKTLMGLYIQSIQLMQAL